MELHEIVGPLVRQDEHHGDADELVDVVQEIPFSEGFIRAGSLGRCVFLKKMTNMYEERDIFGLLQKQIHLEKKSEWIIKGTVHGRSIEIRYIY